jgi:chemotaxis protein CheX
MDATIINPFLTATSKVIADLTGRQVEMGKPFLSTAVFEGRKLLVNVGVVGELRGQVLLEMDEQAACFLATSMMGGMMTFDKLCDLSRSAVSELMNMIMGNAATLLATNGIIIDITPPGLWMGNQLEISIKDIRIIGVPLLFGEHKLELNIAINRK